MNTANASSEASLKDSAVLHDGKYFIERLTSMRAGFEKYKNGEQTKLAIVNILRKGLTQKLVHPGVRTAFAKFCVWDTAQEAGMVKNALLSAISELDLPENLEWLTKGQIFNALLESGLATHVDVVSLMAKIKPVGWNPDFKKKNQ